MSATLTRFQVIGLHGTYTMDVHLEDNILILVGENGTGKSTFVNLIYHFLTRQWGRLETYRFVRINAFFDGEPLVLTSEDVQQYLTTRAPSSSFRARSRILSHFGQIEHELLDAIAGLSRENPLETQEEMVERLAVEFKIPKPVAAQLLRDVDANAKPPHIRELEKHLSALDLGQFLYLPTYRRIEQDLRSIFRGADIEAELRRFRRLPKTRSSAKFIELVEFGMQDVEETIDERMSHIKESVRHGLDNLTGTYLRDVIRGVYSDVDDASMGRIEPTTLEAVFARIDETTLPSADKLLLAEKVAAMRLQREILEKDKVIAHFLLKLIAFHREQQANEQTVRDFVTLCNKYLTGKELVYDNVKYRILIQQLEEGAGLEEQQLPMQALSSGEKQIVSLFSHLYLSGEKRFFVVIDEPELSLSVPWQRRFLPDIVDTGMCTGLVAVTHSPFVWDNNLERYVQALAELTAPLETGRSAGVKRGLSGEK